MTRVPFACFPGSAPTLQGASILPSGDTINITLSEPAEEGPYVCGSVLSVTTAAGADALLALGSAASCDVSGIHLIIRLSNDATIKAGSELFHKFLYMRALHRLCFAVSHHCS